jgi:predicted double-glycine peptidase
MRAGIGAVLAAGAIAAAGCAHAPGDTRVVAPDASWVVVPHMDLIAQRGDFDCGPAALAMAFARWGAAPPPEAPPPAPDGEAGGAATAGELRDEARRAGFRSYVFEGSFDDLAAEVGAGRPVVVGLIHVERDARTPHFAVVVGHDAPRRHWLLADPALGLRTVREDALRTEWARAGWVTLVLFRDEVPPPSSAPPS